MPVGSASTAAWRTRSPRTSSACTATRSTAPPQLQSCICGRSTRRGPSRRSRSVQVSALTTSSASRSPTCRSALRLLPRPNSHVLTARSVTSRMLLLAPPLPSNTTDMAVAPTERKSQYHPNYPLLYTHARWSACRIPRQFVHLV